jgi:hypothetical protein
MKAHLITYDAVGTAVGGLAGPSEGSLTRGESRHGSGEGGHSDEEDLGGKHGWFLFFAGGEVVTW